jgi:hypothetical protein
MRCLIFSINKNRLTIKLTNRVFGDQRNGTYNIANDTAHDEFAKKIAMINGVAESYISDCDIVIVKEPNVEFQEIISEVVNNLSIVDSDETSDFYCPIEDELDNIILLDNVERFLISS